MRWLVAAVLLALLIPVGAVAQEEVTPAPASMDVVLRAIDGVIDGTDADATVSAVLQLRAGDRPREDLRLVTTLFTRVDGRTSLATAMDGDLPGVYSADSISLPDMATGSTRQVTAVSDRAALALVAVDREGVYPLQYQVFQGPDPVGAVLTSLIVLPETAPLPLPTASVVRVHSPTALPLGADIASAGLQAAVAPDAPLRQFAADIDRIIATGSAAGITLTASGRLLDDLDAMADGFRRADGSVVPADARVARRAATIMDQLRRLARRADTQVLAQPYGPADLVALVRGGQGEEAVRMLAIGAARTAAVLDIGVEDEIVVPPDGLDADTLAALGTAQAGAFLIDERFLSFAADDALEPVRRLRTADGGEVRMLVPDADLTQLLADPRGEGGPAVVQRLLAETAAQWMTGGPGGDRSAGVLVAIDILGGVDADAVSRATSAISAAPWLRPMALTTLADSVAPADRVVRLAYPPRSAASELDPEYIRRLGQAREALEPLAALLPDDDPTAGVYAESLLIASSLAYRDLANRPAGAQRIEQVLDRLDAVTGAVEVMPSPPITLTSTTGEVPVTLTNTGDVPVTVRATLASTRFTFAEDSEELTLAPQTSRQLGFEAEALNPGGFAAITVTVADPTGGLTLTQTTISVRSTAFPVVGLIAILGGGVVLVVWGVRQSLRRRPGRHERSFVERQDVA